VTPSGVVSAANACPRTKGQVQATVSSRGGRKRTFRYAKHGGNHRLGDYAPRLSRMDFVSGMRFSELPMCARQRGPTSIAVA